MVEAEPRVCGVRWNSSITSLSVGLVSFGVMPLNNGTRMNSSIGRALIGAGLILFVVGTVMRRMIPRDDIPNIAYLGIYGVACLVIGIGYLIKKRSDS
jgi:hypothetical protein